MLSLQSGGVALAQGEIQLDIRGSASSAPTCLRKESASSSTCVHGALRQLPGCARSRRRRCRRHVPLPTPRCPAPTAKPAAPNPALPSEPRGCRCHSSCERAAVSRGGGEDGRAFGERISRRGALPRRGRARSLLTGHDKALPAPC